MAKTLRADLQLDAAFADDKLPTYDDGEKKLEDKEADDDAINVIEADEEDDGAEANDDSDRPADETDDKDDEEAKKEADEEDAFLALQRSYDELKAEAEKRRQEAVTLKAQADDAARKAAQYQQQAEQSDAEARRTSHEAVKDAIAHTESNIVVLKNEIMRAASEQEWDAFADAQEALTKNTAHLQQLNEAKERAEKAQSEGSKDQTQSQTSASAGDDVEGFINTLSPRSQAWVRAHKSDIFSSHAKRSKAQAAHVMAIADGHEIDSDAYFQELDRYMGYESKAEKPEKAKLQREKGAVASAPPARTNPAQKPSRDVKLTKEQQEAALQIFSDKSRADALALYAKGLQQINSGRTNLTPSSSKYDGGYRGI